ncbi:MAG: proline--tRNA ligase [Opitutales bacterium]|nr:proline--tRNA ligase [Opitutales bacterium]
MRKFAITPTRSENYPEWYQQVVREADLAENSEVRGCMVIKPWGYAIWEQMQKRLDAMFKATGHQNAYFPLFIPLRYLEQEAEHAEGFAKECAVVTHSRLQATEEGKLVPTSPLEEPLIVRPTSETIIGASFARWVHSYRDLPILINQWANVVRWEMRTRLFLRTSEFLWQEGHTVHETAEEAQAEAQRMIEVYRDFAEKDMAMPVLCGEKTAAERFAGAVQTLCIEAMMQDGKALQAGTSHFLGQNFARASNIRFIDRNNQEQFAWTASWGVSTRLIGGLIMTHSDDDGLVLPPRLAAYHVVILPIIHHEADAETVITYCRELEQRMIERTYAGEAIRVFVDTKDRNGGEKKWSWIKKGVPLILEVGPRDLKNRSVYGLRRYTMESFSMPLEEFWEKLPTELQSIQEGLLERARTFRDAQTRAIHTLSEFEDLWATAQGGFVVTHLCEDCAIEAQMKERYNITIRCVLPDTDETSSCFYSQQSTARRVVWAKSY